MNRALLDVINIENPAWGGDAGRIYCLSRRERSVKS